MEFKLNVQIGDSTIEITDDVKNTAELFRRIAFFTELPKTCGNEECNSKNLGVSHRTPQGYNYYELKCLDCGYRFMLGQSQENPGELFPKNWEENHWGKVRLIANVALNHYHAFLYENELRPQRYKESIEDIINKWENNFYQIMNNS